MWNVNEPEQVRLVYGILAADKHCLDAVTLQLETKYGKADLISEVWPFDLTHYYIGELGDNPLRQFISFKKLINPGQLAGIKHEANALEQDFAGEYRKELPRPVNLDPGIFEPSKLVLASTKNFSHRIYIGENMYAEVTLSFHTGKWKSYDYTFPDYKNGKYFDYFSKVRETLVDELRSIRETNQSVDNSAK